MPSTCRLAALAAFVCALVLAAPRAEAQQAARYPEGPRHSPMTAPVVERLRQVLAVSPGRRDVFAKIGDSNTANTTFLTCLAGGDVELGARADLAATRAFFGGRADDRRTSFDRTSLSATKGWLAGQVVAGSPSPLVREIDAVTPAFAVVMLGTNDDRPGGVEVFARNLPRVVDGALARGVIPLLSTLPPRNDAPAADARVLELNRVIRALAESRQVPLMDLYAALLPLPRHGLVADGIHLASVWESGTPRACRFTPAALEKGMNVRNLLVLEALDRARRFLVQGEAPEAEAAPGT
jgi:GDSL-like Lipase/Acylhydrolase family